MAQFRAVIRGQRGEASRLGSKNSGLTVRADGWDSGIRVEARHEQGDDVFDVYVTGGSNARGCPRRIGTLRSGYFAPAASEG